MLNGSDMSAYFGASSPNRYEAVTPPSMRKSLPVMKAPSWPMNSAAYRADFVRRTGAAGRRKFEHPAVAFTARAGQLFVGERR